MNQNPLEISPNEKPEVTAIDIHCTPNKRNKHFPNKSHKFKGISIDLEKDSNQLLLKNGLSSSDRQSELDAYCRHSGSFDGVDVATTQDTIEPETVSHEDSTANHSEQQSNANAVPEATETNNNSQTMDAQVREAYLGLQEAETKLYVNRIIGFFVTMIISSAYMLLITHFNVDPYLIYTFIICYLGYYDMFTIFLVPETLRELWIDSDDFYKLGDITCGLIFIVVLLLRISNIISACYYVSAIFLASLVIYRQTSTTPRKEQTYEVLTRLYYLLQVVMITSKLDGIMDFEWSIVFLPSWLYAAGLLFCFTRSLSGLMSQLMRDHTTSIRSKIIGFVWFLFYRISILSLVGVLAGVVEGRDPGTDHTIIDNASYIVLILSVPLLIASVIKKKMLVNFIVTFELIDSHVLRYSAEELITIHDKLKKITFELQDKKAYFMMVSSTYFLPLDQSPSLNNREHSQAKAVAAKTNKSTLELSEYPLSDKESGNNLQTSLLPQDKEEKNFCYVCCKDPSNTIFTTCGHGGVCLDCAIASVKQKGECLQCRKKIEAIHTIDPNEISSNIIRSMQSYKIVKT